MADKLSDQFSKLSTGIKASWLIPHPNKSGYTFQCDLTLEQLIARQLCETYFKEILLITEKRNRILDFQMKLRPGRSNSLTVFLTHRDVDQESGPVRGDICISCEANEPLARLSLIKENVTTRVWLDAQLRAKFILTPQKHIERLSEMSEEEMVHFWSDTKSILEEEKCSWTSMVINHGQYRKHFHLHMKINIEQNDWNRRIKTKYSVKIRQMRQLLENEDSDTIQRCFGNRQFNQWSGIKSVQK